MNEKQTEENRMDRILKELGDLYEFNRKIQEYKLIHKDERPGAVKEDTKSYDRRVNSGESSE